MSVRFERLPRREDPLRLPEPVAGERGLFLVDGTWGKIAPHELAPGVRTVGELEVIEHLEGGGALVDTRLEEYVAAGTIPGAVAIPHGETAERMGELDADAETVFFCNGPQCAATPNTVEILLAAGFPARAILYYRGGIHDWMTLGLPLSGD